MKIIFAILSLFLSCAAKADGGSEKFKIAASYDLASVAPGDLNSYRQSVLWNGQPTSGSFNLLSGYSVSLGMAVSNGFVSLQYTSLSQMLPSSTVAGTSISIDDSFHYNVVYLIYDFDVYKRDSILWGLGAGLGKSLAYDFHQNSTGSSNLTEDVVWGADVIPVQLRTFLSYAFYNTLRLVLDVKYEIVANELKAKDDYKRMINGVPITKGQTLQTTGLNRSNINVDMSGLRAGLGIAILF